MMNCDFHTHTEFSNDSYTPIDTAVREAIDQGIGKLAITDHCDPNTPNPYFPGKLDVDGYIRALTRVREQYRDKIDIICGIETGITRGYLGDLRNILSMFDFDVVIGSFHCLWEIDVSVVNYSRVNVEKFVGDYYKYILDLMNRHKDFDILGHLSFIDRYTGEQLDYGIYSDVIDEILKLVIAEGKSLEINTSSFQYDMRDMTPRISILKRYRQLGGEMITFGSDAHEPGMYRSHFEEAIDIAKSIGFTRYCTYSKRKPEFNNL